MNKTLSVIKYIINSILITLLCVYAGLYILLKIPFVQNSIKEIGTAELSDLMGTPLTIDHISISPFNKIALYDVKLYDKEKKSLLAANKIMAGIDLYELINGKIVITNAQLFGFDINVRKKDPKSPFNFQFLIEAFKPKKKKSPSSLDFQLNSIIIRRGNLSYDLLSEEKRKDNLFDRNHILIHNLSSTLSLKSLKKDSINIFVKRFSFEEQSGIALKRLSFRFKSNKQEALLENLKLETRKSKIEFGNIKANISRTKNLKQFCDSAQLEVKINHSQIALSDLAPFSPAFRKAKEEIHLTCDVKGSVNSMQMKSLHLNYAQGGIVMNMKGSLDGITHIKEAYLFAEIQNLDISQAGITSLTNDISKQITSPIIARMGNLHFLGNISGFMSNLVAYGQLNLAQGTIHSDILIGHDMAKNSFEISGDVETRDFKMGELLGNEEQLGNVSLKLNVDLKHINGLPAQGKLIGEIAHIDYNKYPFENIKLNGQFIGHKYDGMLEIDDPNGYLHLEGSAALQNKNSTFKLQAKGKSIHMHELFLTPKYKGSDLSFNMNVNFSGNHLDNADGTVSVDSLSFANNGDTLNINKFRIEAYNSLTPQQITIHSDILNGNLSGSYSFRTIPATIKDLLSDIFPNHFTKREEKKSFRSQKSNNNFTFRLDIPSTEKLSKILEWPASVIKPATITGICDENTRFFEINTHFPEITLGKMRIESGNVLLEKRSDKLQLSLHGNMINAKKKYILLGIDALATDNRIESRINWSNAGYSTYCGELSATAYIKQPEATSAAVDIKMNPSQIIINDTTWKVSPAMITLNSGNIDVNNFEIKHDNQFLKLEGRVSDKPNDELCLRLQDINLNYIFETLNINHVTFGGQATGDFFVTNLFDSPIIRTDNFYVHNFSYNDAIMGNLKLHSRWDNKNQGILLQGNISKKDTKDTGIYGYIFPTKDSLHLQFDANRLNLAFIRPFTDKVLKNLRGEADGLVTFYGKFRALNVVGDVKTHNFAFDVEYTNTSYLISDSVKFTTSSISFKDITVYDQNRNIAKATGTLHHRNFKNLNYNINIHNAYNFLMFNVPNTSGTPYYGTVYASGGANFRGDLEKTNIDVNVRTNARSRFSYVLPTNQTANEYQFITFINKRERYNKKKDTNTPVEKIAPPTSNNLTINIQVEATPDVTMQLVMDPVSMDVIKANGNGAMRMVYNSQSDFKMYGTYTVEKGSYNFSLQDLIMRDFGIKSGSSISFRGAPMSADLNIEGIYSLTANLQDLDESFAQEKELNRTSVPVQTVLSVSGDLQHPDLKFDIQFPTLSQDVERRVRSIISTDDMMNRQIIYLLALGKFYTPDYLNTGQRNELASVASSTLSSQLNNILGQISDKWNIGTNIRSDKGDFSDVEFELALSSQLLNNRLLFNGNLGYRDNLMSSNNFIGDFDLEYLLTKSGNFRLKAYNHYNDKNFYIKSALTTQGVGLIFKRDFTRFGDLFIRSEKQKKSAVTTDSISFDTK